MNSQICHLLSWLFIICSAILTLLVIGLTLLPISSFLRISSWIIYGLNQLIIIEVAILAWVNVNSGTTKITKRQIKKTYLKL